MKKLVAMMVAALTLSVAMTASADPKPSSSKKYTATKPQAASFYGALTSGNLNPGWMEKSKSPNKKSGGAPSQKDAAKGKPQIGISVPLLNGGNGSWSISISTSVQSVFMGKKADRQSGLSVSYNSTTGEILASGSIEVSKTVDFPVWPFVVAKIGGGLGIEVYGSTSAGEINIKPYGKVSGGVGIGIPWINASINIDVKVYVRIAFVFNPVTVKRYVGYDVTLVAQVQVFIVIWQQDWKLFGSEKQF